jgi:PhnB protein
MTSRLNPYLTFDGNAREAMEFYAKALDGTLSTDTFGEYGETDPGVVDKIMHARLETPKGFTLMASDSAPGVEVKAGNTMSVSISGDDDRELRGYWDKLSEGAVITMPLEKQVWGDIFGMCTDRFGVAWMVNIAQPEG